jgi:hypothetical protein
LGFSLSPPKSEKLPFLAIDPACDAARQEPCTDQKQLELTGEIVDPDDRGANDTRRGMVDSTCIPIQQQYKFILNAGTKIKAKKSQKRRKKKRTGLLDPVELGEPFSAPAPPTVNGDPLAEETSLD